MLLALALAACSPEVPTALGPDAEDLAGQVEVLLITPASLEPAWEDWVAWKRARGLAVEVVTVEELDAAEVGEDLPARLRAGIARYAALGTRYVVLGGDENLLPVREVSLWADAHLDDGYIVETFASELYYADLDGTWDEDGDGEYAEIEDNPDLWPDLIVARLPARGQEEVATWTDKVFAYERWPILDYQARITLMGEYAGNFSGFEFYSSSAQEALILPNLPLDADVTRLYSPPDDYPGALDNTETTQKSAFNEGQSFVLNFGHGSEETLSNLRLDDLWALENRERPMLLATVECHGCAFHVASPEHVACEAFVLAEGGGVAYLGNTTYGIGFPSLTDFYILFSEVLYQSETPPTFGEAMFEVQAIFPTEETLTTEGHTDRWTQLALVMVGDPTVPVWRGPASALTLTESETAGCYSVEANGRPLAGATVTLSGGVQWRALTGADGVACPGTDGASHQVVAWKSGFAAAELQNP